MNKRAQITAFIVVGLILLVSIATVSYIKQIGEPREDYKNIYEVTSSVKPVRTYIEQCLKNVGTITIHNISIHGGILDPEEYQFVNGGKINYLCYDEQGIGCKNKLLFRQDIEDQINTHINKKILECVDLGIFKDQGFNVITEIPETNTKIKNNEVVLTLKYPIKLSKEKLNLEISTFYSTIELPLGILLKTSINILNDELQDSYFDAPKFLQEHADIKIQKFKPYPDIIYKIEKDKLIFQFAIHTKDTISEPGYNFYGLNNNDNIGCCYNPNDNFCYQNALKEECEAKDGIYSTQCTCNEIEYSTKIKLNPVLGCTNTFDRTGNKYSDIDRANGESWCSYDTIGTEEKALVGSRHYIHYCIEGEEYIESCRDYREEVCAETTQENVLGNTISKAQCQPNRYQDCMTCESQKCCEDTEVRDCSWKDFETDNKCVPKVAPGFKFWELNALAVCTQANQQKECFGSSFSCPEKWVDDTAKLCYLQGDCGNARNPKQVLTKYGFINTDLKNHPDNKIYSIDTNVTEKTIIENLDIPYNIKQRAAVTPITYSDVVNSHIELLSVGLNYLNEFSSVSAADFINPFKEKPAMRILDVSLCSVWQPPRIKQDCSYCTRTDFQECSEYLCKSLGQQCVFDYNNGKPECKRIKYDDRSPEITISDNIKNEELTVTEINFNAKDESISGYKIQPKLAPYESFTLGIKADEPVTCKLALMPFRGFNDLPGIYFGEQSFKMEHNLTIKAPPQISIPENIIDMLNVTNLKDFADLIEEPEEVVNSYKKKFKFHITLYNTFTGNDITEFIDPIAEKIKGFIAMSKKEAPLVKEMIEYSLNSFQNNTYVVYLKCMDEAGNENINPFFIEFGIKDTNPVEDKKTAKLIGAIPANNSLVSYNAEDDETNLKIYIDEPAECRYDFIDINYEDLKYKFLCSIDEYRMSPKFGGSYECKTKLNTTEDNTEIYIRCKDKPYSTEDYNYYIKESNENSIEGLEQGMFFNVTPPNKIYTALYKNKQLEFKINTEENNNTLVQLNLYKDDLNTCTYSFGTYKDTLNNCKKTDKLYLGTYECIEEIDLSNGKIEDIYNIVLNKQETQNQGLENTNEQAEYSYDLNEIENHEIVMETTTETALLNLVFIEPYTCELINQNNIKTDMECSKESCSALITQNTQKIACMQTNYLHNISIACLSNKESMITEQNINTESFVYTIKKASTFNIIETQPEGEVTITNPKLKVKTTNKDVKCRYKTDLSLSYIDMIKESLDDGEWFTSQLSELDENLNSFSIKCEDTYGNIAEEYIEFYVISQLD
jgi:hypothetical protein